MRVKISEMTIPESGLSYVREKDFNSNIESLAETCSALLQRIEALEKLTEDQTRTIISFTDLVDSQRQRIERLEDRASHEKATQ